MSESLLEHPELVERIWQSFGGPQPPWEQLEDFESLARRFIELKMHLGCRFHGDGRTILDFVRFLKDRGCHTAAEIPLDLFIEYWDGHRHVRDRTWNRYLGSLSVWLDHLQSIGKIQTNPCALLRRHPPQDYVPYIFSVEQMRRIVRPAGADPLRADRAVLYHLIYSCGLRLSEATKLNVARFDAAEATIFIRRGKFGKDRLLPLHPSLVERLGQYLRTRRENPQQIQLDAPLLVNAAGRRWSPTEASRHFHDDLTKLGIYQPTRVVGGIVYGSPRVHAMRHSFAVHRLIRWYRQGADVQAKLPLLSTYLGHSKPEHSQVYLRTTGMLLREADKRFTGAFQKQFPLES